MTDDMDIWRAANLLIERYGADAAIVAAQRADDLTGSFCTKRFDRNKLGKELCDAKEEVQP